MKRSESGNSRIDVANMDSSIVASESGTNLGAIELNWVYIVWLQGT